MTGPERVKVGGPAGPPSPPLLCPAPQALRAQVEEEGRQQETFTPNLRKPRPASAHGSTPRGSPAEGRPGSARGGGGGGGGERAYERLYALSEQKKVAAAATATSSATTVGGSGKKLSVEAQESLADTLYRDAAVRAWRQNEAVQQASCLPPLRHLLRLHPPILQVIKLFAKWAPK